MREMYWSTVHLLYLREMKHGLNKLKIYQGGGNRQKEEFRLTHLHDVILPHVGEVAVAVGGVEAAEKRGALVDVVEADEAAEAVQEVGVAQRPEVVPEDGGLVGSLARTDVENPDLVSFVAGRIFKNCCGRGGGEVVTSWGTYSQIGHF